MQRLAVGAAPGKLALANPRPLPEGEPDAVVRKVPEQPVQSTEFLEFPEDDSDHVARLLVGVEHDLSGGLFQVA